MPSDDGRVPDWLQHLRRDRRGIPVPYVNLWGVEDENRFDVRHDPHVPGLAVFLDDSRETEPDFTRQHMGRQRECVCAGLCQVCGRPVPWSRRTLVIADLSVERVDIPGQRQVPVVKEPWLCSRCADFAVSRCPALIRRSREERLTIVPVTSKRHCQLVLSRGWIDGPLEELSRRRLPFMWAKILLTGVDITLAAPPQNIIRANPTP